MKINDLILQTTTKIISLIILSFSLYIFFAGHNNPGGGFSGGLMAAAALVLLYIAYDIKTLHKAIPIDYKKLAALGLLIAVGTGMGAFYFGFSFLTQAFRFFSLPILGELELASALLFDLGVYFTVIGVTMTIILTIGEDVE